MIDRALEAICAALLAATVLVAFVAVIFRYVLGSALSWSFEASLMLLTYLTFLGSYLAMRRNAHLKVEVLAAKLPRVGQLLVFSLNQLVIVGVASIMVVYGIRQVALFHSQTSLVIELPLSLLYAVIPVGGLLMGLQGLVELRSGLRRWRHGAALFEAGAGAKAEL